MKLIIGLGNHGEKYRYTRHNFGFLAVEELASRWDIGLLQKGFRSIYGRGVWNGEQVLLVQPQTYMNLSGWAAREIATYFKVDTSSIIVIHDDLDFPFGIARLKIGGGHGGHKGLVSLIEELGMADFIRVRIGIDKPARKEEVESYVLKLIAKEQLPELSEILERVADIVEGVVTEGAIATMNRFHGE